jgi:hypothetical protein
MMEPSFEKLLALLAESGVRFIVVGGIAVTLHGYVRLTEDVDILLDAAPDNILRLIGTLSGYGQGYAAELAVEDFDETEGAIRIVEETEGCQIDLFTRMTGRVYADVLADAACLTVKGHAVRYASKSALIAWKENSVREKDRLDALALRKLQENPDAFR